MVSDKNSAGWEMVREDIELLPGGALRSGAPAWVLHDPAAGKFYRIGLLEFEILKRWHYADPERIVQEVRQDTLLRPDVNDVLGVYGFLKSSFLLDSGGADGIRNMLAVKKGAESGGLLRKLLRHYLFFRIPLFRPDRILNRIKPFADMFFNRFARFGILVLAFVGFFLVLRELDDFIAGFKVLQSPSGVVAGFITLVIAKIVHEFGHAITCKHYGCRVPVVGVAFIVMWPLLWTDTTQAWRLTDRKKRLVIDAAGMGAELILAAVASILWVILPAGAFKDSMHLLAGVTWVMTLLVNLNPFMRFDGYYLLSDFLDVPNLQERAFALAKVRIRRVLWGIKSGVRKDGDLSDRLETLLVLYAWGVWVYRFFLFLGIALLVYHFFFKALGVFLMMVELWWFIALPIVRELVYWFENRESIVMSSYRKSVIAGVVIAVLFLLFVPWRGVVRAPAILRSEQEIPLVAGKAGRIAKVNVVSGQRVSRGDVLFVLERPDILYDLKQAVLAREMVEEELKAKLVAEEYYSQAVVARDRLGKLYSDVLLKEAEKELLVVSAPIDGVVVDVPDDVLHSDWVGRKDGLGMVVSEKGKVEAFVREEDLELVSTGAKGRFYTGVKAGKVRSFPVVVKDVDMSPLKEIPYPEMGSDYGGDINVRINANGASVPDGNYYKVTLAGGGIAGVSKTKVGALVIKTKPRSVFTKVHRKIISVFIRESGF